MPRKLRIYLDTSVPNAYLDDINRARQSITRNFWENLEQYEIFVSDLVVREIKETKDPAKRQELLRLIQKFKKLPSDTEEVRELTQRYLMEGIFTVTQIDDATHVAVATTNYLNILVSWNRPTLGKN